MRPWGAKEALRRRLRAGGRTAGRTAGSLVAVTTWRGAASLLLLPLLLGPAPASAREAAEGGRKLQLYVMPDTQSWAWNQGGDSLATWQAVADALCRQRERFAMVLHTGDMVDLPRLRPAEWDGAGSAMQRLDACRMPYAIAFGNHDFDNYPPPGPEPRGEGDRGWKALRARLAYQPQERAPSGRSALTPLAPGWFVLTLDFTPSSADLAWAAAEIAKRPEASFLVLNHHCIDRNGVGKPWCAKLFEEQPRIRIAVSGHWLGRVRDAWREVPRAKAPPLIALYQNYQHVPALAAWGVVVELDPASGAVCVWSENLLDGAIGHPAASAREVGPVEAGSPRRCLGGR